MPVESRSLLLLTVDLERSGHLLVLAMRVIHEAEIEGAFQLRREGPCGIERPTLLVRPDPREKAVGVTGARARPADRDVVGVRVAGSASTAACDRDAARRPRPG